MIMWNRGYLWLQYIKEKLFLCKREVYDLIKKLRWLFKREVIILNI